MDPHRSSVHDVTQRLLLDTEFPPHMTAFPNDCTKKLAPAAGWRWPFRLSADGTVKCSLQQHPNLDTAREMTTTGPLLPRNSRVYVRKRNMDIKFASNSPPVKGATFLCPGFYVKNTKRTCHKPATSINRKFHRSELSVESHTSLDNYSETCRCFGFVNLAKKFSFLEYAECIPVAMVTRTKQTDV